MVKQAISSRWIKVLLFIFLLIIAFFIGLFIAVLSADEKEQTMQQITALTREKINTSVNCSRFAMNWQALARSLNE